MKTKQWGTAKRTSFDGVMKQEFATQAHEPGRIIVNSTQPDRGKILERNKAIRNDKLERDLSFGRHVACVPLEDYEVLKRKFPGLTSRDMKVKTQTWARILKDPNYKHLLVVDKY